MFALHSKSRQALGLGALIVIALVALAVIGSPAIAQEITQTPQPDGPPVADPQQPPTEDPAQDGPGETPTADPGVPDPGITPTDDPGDQDPIGQPTDPVEDKDTSTPDDTINDPQPAPEETKEPPPPPPTEVPTDKPTEGPPPIAPTVVTVVAPTPVTIPLKYQPLVNEAGLVGSIRVIVGLNVPFQVESVIDPSQVGAQRAAIQGAQAGILNELAGTNYRVHNMFWAVPFMAVSVDQAGMTRLATSRGVVSIERDQINAIALDNATLITGAALAHTKDIKGSGQTVAIIDTGVDRNHPFLKDALGATRVVAEGCFSSDGVVFGYNNQTLCPNGQTQQIGPGAADPITKCVTEYGADCSHGTHVAGIAAGAAVPGSAAITFNGAAPEAQIIGVQVFTYFPDEGDVFTWTSDYVAGLQYVYGLRDTYDIAAVNLSLGGGAYSDQATCDADNRSVKAIVDSLRAANIATVVASGNVGNTGALSSPACISSAVSVGATTDSDLVAGFSNSAPFLSLLAPGVAIYSSVPDNGTCGTDGCFANFSGTSMSAPHVAGAWALYKSRQGNHNKGVAEVLFAFQNTGEPITDTRNGVTTPRLQVDEALHLKDPVTPLPTEPPSSVPGDDFDIAFAIPGLPYDSSTDSPPGALIDLDNFSAYHDDPTPSCTYGNYPIQHSVWFSFTPATNAFVTFSAFGSTLITGPNLTNDSVIGVYTGTRGNLTEVACNDDANGTLTSLLTMPVTAGQTYYILTGGWWTTTGDFLLTAEESTVPVNDDFNDALEIPALPYANSDIVTHAGSVAADDPLPGCAGTNGLLGPTVWWTYTPAVDQRVRFSAGSNFDTRVSVWTGTRGSLDEVACGYYGVDVNLNLAERLAIAGHKPGALSLPPEDAPLEGAIADMQAGVTYTIMVDGWAGSSGLVDLNVTEILAPPDNDEYPGTTVPDLATLDPVEYPGGYYQDVVDMTNATRSPYDPFSYCAYPGNKTVWYTYTPDHPGVVEIDVSNTDFDGNLANTDVAITVYSLSGSFLIPEACSTGGTIVGGLDVDAEGLALESKDPDRGLVLEGEGRLAVPMGAGTVYRIMISTLEYDEDTVGNLDFRMQELAPALANDDFDSPTEITALPFTDSVPDTVAVTNGLDDPYTTCAPAGHTLWYTYTPAQNQRLRIDTIGSSFDTVVGVFVGARGALTEVACNDDTVRNNVVYSRQSLLDVDVAPGQTYYIMVGGYSNAYGALVLNVQNLAAPGSTPLPEGSRPIPIRPANREAMRNRLPSFAWQPVLNATEYELQVDNNRDFSSPIFTVHSTTSSISPRYYFDDGRYFWRVRVSQPATGPWSPLRWFDVDNEGPTVSPVTISPKNNQSINTNTPTFRWGRVPGAAGYFLQVSQNPDFSGTSIFSSDVGNKNVYRFGPTEALYEPGFYYWRVWARDGAFNYGPISATAQFIFTNLKAPANEKVFKSSTPVRPLFTWAAMTGITNYRLVVDNDPDFSSPIINHIINRISYRATLAEALGEGIYYWRVDPDTPLGFQESDVVFTFTVTSTVPPAPVLLSPPGGSRHATNIVEVSWQAINTDRYGRVMYEVQLDAQRNFGSPITLSGTSVTAQQLPALAEGTYFWRVRAVTDLGVAGRWSGVRSFIIDIP